VGKIEEYETKANELLARAKEWKLAEEQQLREQLSSFEASVLWKEAMDHDNREETIDALAKYEKAAECYLRVTKESTTPPERVKKLEGDITRILDRVGELKRKIQGIDTDRSPLPKPATSRQHSNANQPDKLTPEEIKVLTWSSTIASKVFVPWFDEEARAYNYFPPQPWIDPDGDLKLSEKQKETFFKWKRPSEILAMRGQTWRNITMIDTITPDTIKQHCVSDCSFIAGLCISAEFERKFKRRLITSLIHPQDPNTGKPIYNPKGVYMVKLWFNGVERKVLVDDLLPVDKGGELLCSHTKNNDGCLELWVPILEKVRAHIIISFVCIGNLY
jgi:calpain-7